MGKATMIFEKFIEAVVSQIVNFFPVLISNLPTKASARAELDKLRDRATRIQARLADAEQKHQIENENESVLLWLSELRSIASDTEDLKEEFEARARIATQASHWTLLSSAWYYRCVLSRVDEINNKYDNIYKDRKAQMLHECDQACPVTTTRRSDTCQTSSFGNVSLHGRQEEYRRLLDLLLDLNNTYFPPVLSITGESGMGKTALARSAFNHPAITDHFNLLIWVSLSPNSDPVETIRKIIEGIPETNCNLPTLDMLQRYLQQLLRGKMFLLVLDGVYTEDVFFWENVQAPLSTAQSGSKVLVTTQSLRTAQYMGSSDQVALTDLDSTSLWLILKDEALPQISTLTENLESIGKELAEKCYGSPLAAKLLGRTLCGITDEEEWNRLLQDMPGPDAVVDNILPVIADSSETLPNEDSSLSWVMWCFPKRTLGACAYFILPLAVCSCILFFIIEKLYFCTVDLTEVVHPT